MIGKPTNVKRHVLIPFISYLLVSKSWIKYNNDEFLKPTENQWKKGKDIFYYISPTTKMSLFKIDITRWRSKKDASIKDRCIER